MIKKPEANFTSVIPAGGSRWEDPQNAITESRMLKHEVWLGAIKPDHPDKERFVSSAAPHFLLEQVNTNTSPKQKFIASNAICIHTPSLFF